MAHVAWGTSGHQVYWSGIWVVAIIGLFINVALAHLDRESLKARGFRMLPSPLWAIVAPLYLWIRGSSVFDQSSAGLGPFWAQVAQISGWPVISIVISLWGGLIGTLNR